MIRAPPANKAVFWCLVAFTVLLLYVESYGPEGLFAYDDLFPAPLRAPEIYFQFDDEAEQGVLLHADYSSGNDFRDNASKSDQEDRSVKIDVSYLEDFAKMGSKKEPFDESKLKTILVWNNGYGSMTEGVTPDDTRELERVGCPQPNCVLVNDRTRLPIKQYDAIIFHFRSTTLNDLPKERSPSQRWLFKETEPASYVFQYPHDYNGMMNWTYTYRLDSDIPAPYGRIRRKVAPEVSATERPLGEGVGNKTKMAAWFVSNCNAHSGRDAVVRGLKKYMPVDVFGKCSLRKCPNDKNKSCYKMVEQKYKFYLSFENSLCKDYVTEKFFNILQYRVVPVVYGSADYAAMAPPHSYVSALDFPTVSKLAEYLHYLANNDTAYQEYFKWKDEYEVVDQKRISLERICHICLKLHSDQSYKVYDNLDKWFIGESTCKKLKKKDTFSWKLFR